MSDSSIREAVTREPATVRQSAVTAGAGWIAFVLGSLLFAALGGTTPPDGRALAGLLLSPQVIVWVLSVVALGAVARRLSARAVAAWDAALAPIATTACVAVTSPAALTGSALPVVVVVLAWQIAGLLGAAIVGALAGLAFRRGFRARSARGAAMAIGLALTVVGGAAALALPGHWFAAYFRLGGESATVTPEQADRYLAIAGTALAALTIALAAALVARRGGLAWLTGTALVLALLTAFVFQVPRGRFIPERVEPQPYNTNYVPCYSGSGDCN